MTTDRNSESGAAFPILERGGNGLELTDAGLTKREVFAAMAMQGLLADSKRFGTNGDYAEWAVGCADALIDELKKRGQS